MTSAAVLVVTALPEETRPVRRALRGRRDVVVATTGDGAERARAATRDLLAEHRPRLLVVAGLAGSLTSGAAPGDVRLAREVRDEVGRVRHPDALLLERAREAGVAEDVLVSARSLARTPEERDRTRRLARVLVPGTGLVDLETAACVDTAVEAGVAWLAVRAVSDGPDDLLPAWLEEARDARGSISRGAIIGGAVLRPGRIPALIALGRRARRAGRALGDAVASIVMAAVPAVESGQRRIGNRA